MEKDNKIDIKLRLAACFKIIIRTNKTISDQNKINNIEDLRLVDSMRQWEATSGISYTIIQGTTAGKRNIHFSTLMRLLDSIDMSFTDFAKLYDSVTEKQITEEFKVLSKAVKKKK